MRPIQEHSVSVTDQARRNTVEAMRDSHNNPPTIVSISDIHGYLDRARSALLTLRDRTGYDPVVVSDKDGRLQWADGNHILVFNGDLVDRGPANEGVLQMVSRLAAQAPPGRVRVTLGNHEAIALSADYFSYPWYSGQANEQDRRALLKAIQTGLVIAAYRGYNYTYAHAGADDLYDIGTVNEELLAATDDLLSALGTDDDIDTQEVVINKYQRILGVGNGLSPKSKGAGLVWLDLEYISTDAPPQVVGHTRSITPTQKGNVVCQNVLRENERSGSPGGEAVFVETPDQLVAVTRTEGGGTREQQY